MTTPDIEKVLSNTRENRNNANHDDANYASSHQSYKHEEEEIARIPTHTSRRSKSKNVVTGLAKTLTARSNATLINPGPPPDGGARAWIQACMGQMVIANTFGLLSSWGAFQAHYTNDLNFEPSAVSWIGSMQMLGHFSLGMITGRLFDAGYFYHSVIPGMLIAATGMFMTSLSTQYYQFFLAQGLMIGIGCGMQFAPCMSLIATYFAKNRSIALAIMASGSATGGLVYPTIARQLLPRIGFAWTVRTMGFIMLAIGACYCSLLKPRLPPRKSGPILELSAFKELPYSLFILAVFLISLGQYFAFYYIASFAVDVLHLPYSTSINVLLCLNGIGIFGRLIPSYFADKHYGAFNVLVTHCIISTIILYFWPLVTSESSLYGWAIVYGFFVAGFQGLFPAVLTNLTKDMSKVGTRNGQGFAIIGMGTFVGPPIAGALIQSRGGDYLAAQMFAGSAVLVGSAILVAARCAITGLKLKVRV
ncbi:MFS general substrate transporter [Dothidotthia symphoricarpi CBS 119687]|uniref:MFS general substrate transporter n=1 Tax=Dothidotthia symphoricarpi CBS 119687 TaxID=1392245 RepID=A0A6A6A3U9_9PLEO|nr:MFS general substrate transporter [Dothidotthia symphoricarpi CBS 119687]KAF2125418.1 MFS general substrate transporter [Dothidotthia symphoricarpi CBS 119687]